MVQQIEIPLKPKRRCLDRGDWTERGISYK